MKSEIEQILDVRDCQTAPQVYYYYFFLNLYFFFFLQLSFLPVAPPAVEAVL